MKKIEVIGVGGAFSYELGNTSFLLWDEAETSAILFDCGFSVYPKLRALEKEENREIIKKIDTVFISHAHDDHIGSLGALLAHRYFVCSSNTNIVGLDVVPYNAITHPLGFDFVFDCDVSQFEIIPTKHTPDMPSFACKAGGVFYSGDTGYSLLDTELAISSDVIIHEVSLHGVPLLGWGEGDFIHVGIEELIKNSSLQTRSKTWLCHYSTSDKASLRKKARENGFKGLLSPGQIIEL